MAYTEQYPHGEQHSRFRPQVEASFTADEWLQMGIAQLNARRRAMAKGDERAADIANELMIYCIDRADAAARMPSGKAAISS